MLFYIYIIQTILAYQVMYSMLDYTSFGRQPDLPFVFLAKTPPSSLLPGVGVNGVTFLFDLIKLLCDSSFDLASVEYSCNAKENFNPSDRF